MRRWPRACSDYRGRTVLRRPAGRASARARRARRGTSRRCRPGSGAAGTMFPKNRDSCRRRRRGRANLRRVWSPCMVCSLAYHFTILEPASLCGHARADKRLPRAEPLLGAPGPASAALSLLRRYRSDRSREACMGRRIHRPVPDLGARWILAKEVVTFPIPRRSDWSGNKAATTIWTDVAQNVVDTGGAKRALVKVQMRASSESGGNALLQCSQVGLSSSMVCRSCDD